MVERFDLNGNFLSQWTGGIAPSGITVDNSGNVYVVDQGGPANNSKIQKFDSAGNYLSQVGNGGGNGTGQFLFPSGIAISASGNIYVIDAGNNRVEKFDAKGNYVFQWGKQGSGLGQYKFTTPLSLFNGMVVDKNENVYVADSANDRVEKTLYPYVFSNLNVLGVYPTPVRSGQNANIAFHLNSPGNFFISVKDSSGNTVAQYQGQGNEGDNVLQWNLVSASGSVIDAGSYFVNLQSGNIQVTQKLVYLP